MASTAFAAPSGPPGLRPRPSSARGRLNHQQSQPQQAPGFVGRSQGSQEPYPDHGGTHSGPGQYRNFGGDSRHQFRDPLRHGSRSEAKDRELYAIGPNGPRTLDVSKLNKDRHNWQRLDTFQTPYGIGQASCQSSAEGARSRQTTRTGTLSPRRSQGWATSPGFFFDDFRLELQAAVSEIKEELAAAVNQTIAELRKDVRAEGASICHHLGHTSSAEDIAQVVAEVREATKGEAPEGGTPIAQQLPDAAEITGQFDKLMTEVERNRKELLSGQERLMQEIRNLFVQSDQSRILQAVQGVSAEVEKVQESSKAHMKPVLAAIADSTSEICSVVHSSKKTSSEAIIEKISEVDASIDKVHQKLQLPEVFEELKRMTSKLDEVPQKSDLSLTNNEIRKAVLLLEHGNMQSHFLELQTSLNALTEVTRKFDIAVVLEEVKRWQKSVDLSPITAAVERTLENSSKFDLTPVVKAISANEVDLSPLKECVEKSTPDLLPLLVKMDEFRRDMGDLIQKGAKDTCQKKDVMMLFAAINNVREQDVPKVLKALKESHSFMTKTANSDGEVFRVMKDELHQVLEKVQSLPSNESLGEIIGELQRSQSQSDSNVVVAPEVDLRPIISAVEDHRKASAEFTSKLAEEVHQLHRSSEFDNAKLLAAIEEIDFVKIQKLLRETKVTVEDLDPLKDGLRRLSEEVRKPSRELSQLLDELTTVKLDVQRQRRHEADQLAMLKEISQAPRDVVDFSEVHREFHSVKSYMQNLQKDLKEGFGSLISSMEVVQAENKDGGYAVLLSEVAKTVEEARRVASIMDLAPLCKEIQEVKAKVELSSALKRKNESFSKADMAAMLEELRGHFSLVLQSLREGSESRGDATAAPERLQVKEKARGEGQDLNDLLTKLHDAQNLIAQAGCRHEKLMGEVQDRLTSQTRQTNTAVRQSLHPPSHLLTSTTESSESA